MFLPRKTKYLYFGFKPLFKNLSGLQIYIWGLYLCGNNICWYDTDFIFSFKILSEVTQWSCSIERKIVWVYKICLPLTSMSFEAEGWWMSNYWVYLVQLSVWLFHSWVTWSCSQHGINTWLLANTFYKDQTCLSLLFNR